MRMAGNEIRQAGKGVSQRVKKETARQRSGRKKGGRGRGGEVGVLDSDLHMSILTRGSSPALASDWASGLSPVKGMEQGGCVLHIARCLR